MWIHGEDTCWKCFLPMLTLLEMIYGAFQHCALWYSMILCNTENLHQSSGVFNRKMKMGLAVWVLDTDNWLKLFYSHMFTPLRMIFGAFQCTVAFLSLAACNTENPTTEYNLPLPYNRLGVSYSENLCGCVDSCCRYLSQNMICYAFIHVYPMVKNDLAV